MRERVGVSGKGDGRRGAREGTRGAWVPGRRKAINMVAAIIVYLPYESDSRVSGISEADANEDKDVQRETPPPRFCWLPMP